MLSKNDCILLLTELSNKGVDTKKYLNKCLLSKDVDLEVVKFINDNRQLDVTKFYEKIRKSYNNKSSKLYINIMKELNENNITEVLTTLNALSLQILLFSKSVDNKKMFFDNVRLREIYKVLLEYSYNYNIDYSINLLKLIKADIKALESVYR